MAIKMRPPAVAKFMLDLTPKTQEHMFLWLNAHRPELCARHKLRYAREFREEFQREFRNLLGVKSAP